MDGGPSVAPLLRKTLASTASTNSSDYQELDSDQDMDANRTQRVPGKTDVAESPSERSPTSPNERSPNRRGRLDSRASYADYLRSVQEVLASEETGAPSPRLGAGERRPAPAEQRVSVTGVSPNIRGRASLGMLVGPSPLLNPQLKASPVHAVSCAFKPTAEELEEFILDEPTAETETEACRCCGAADTWVDVTCFADGQCECSCGANPRWALCEQCCELLVHDECLASQAPKVQDRRGVQPPKQDASVLPAGGEAFYEGLLETQEENDGWQPQPGYNPYADNPYAADPYHQDPWYGGAYGSWNSGSMGMAQGMYPQPVPTVVDLQNMGADLTQICVEFAATSRCPRGLSCRWIHCKV